MLRKLVLTAVSAVAIQRVKRDRTGLLRYARNDEISMRPHPSSLRGA